MIYLPNNGKRGRMLIGFLPNKESIRGARANPMHFYSLRELASEEPSESGKYVGTLHLFHAIEGANKTWLVNRDRRNVRPTALEAEGAKLAQKNLTVGQHDGSVISCVGTDRDLKLYVRSVAS